MYQKNYSFLPLWYFDTLSNFSNVKHYVSGRSGGISKNVFSSLNLSYNVGDDSTAVEENRKRIQVALNAQKLLFPHQTHSANVIQVKTGKEDLSNADALITNVPGICISVMSADCVPILIYDPVQKAVAAIHSGWRGTVAKILTIVIDLLKKEYNSSASDLIVCIGPSISQEEYEVGGEVIELVDKTFGRDADIVKRKENGKGNLDLWAANLILLKEAGVKEINIEIASICTYRNDAEFFSARKSGNNTGRFAAGIMIE